ncbi:MAG: hypothetical protein ABI868_21660 [Acidobacteriota bacterium]
MTTHNSLIFVALIAVSLCAAEARAQTDNRLALGASVTSRVASSDTAGSSASVGFEWRLGHQKQAWGWQTTLFNWFGSDVEQQTTAGRPTELGELRIRPMMVGYGYTMIRGRAAITADMVAGVAFNSLHVNGATAAEYLRLGGANISAEATNTFAAKPEVQVWYDLNRRIGLKINGGYLITRPTVTINSTLGTDKWKVKADSFLLTFGVVYSII